MRKRDWRVKVRKVECRRRTIDRIVRAHYVPWATDQLFASSTYLGATMGRRRYGDLKDI